MNGLQAGARYRVTVEGVATVSGFVKGDGGNFQLYDNVLRNAVSVARINDPVGDVIGVEVWVTGDTDDFGHDFEPGTLVKIVDDEVAEEGSYFCELPDNEDESWYVGANDLSIDPPVVTYGPGTVVESRRTGAVYTLHADGYYSHRLNMFFRDSRAFTSERFTPLTP